ncbi:hypothetical protein IEO21_04895 [Rhodonia placenta]|uniref:P-loop containing nucleoside triphosphate hydrolase protein n=1 Tax=Rhodonia placenta TaxID=104341 RepID=A0A8H7P306_9APHY|nr:hypothetical protein IEO21_04895 [Postia placenta]
MPADLPSLINMALSFSALREWLKLILFGGVIEYFRRCAFGIWDRIMDSIWITVTFDEDDTSYSWVLFWLSRQPSWGKARRVEVTTRNYGLTSPAVNVLEDSNDRPTDRPMSFLPSISSTYSMWFNRHYMTVSRAQVQNGYNSTKETLHLRILARNTGVLKQFLLECKQLYQKAEENSISIWMSDTYGNWSQMGTRPKRPLQSIILEPGVKELLLDDAHDFLDSQDWYTDRGIPFRRGYLLYGAPGSGKTSMIQSIAGELGLDVYIVTLSRSGMDDNALSELISELPARCIALMEDIDAAFSRPVTRDLGKDKKPEDENPEGASQDRTEDSTSRVTLSGLLNALDGIGAQEGRILFATTNDYAALDPALIRPGRMDLHVEFRLASKYQAQELFRCFYTPSKSRGKRADGDDDEKATDALDSGYGSRASSIDEREDAPPLDTPPSPTESESSTGELAQRVRSASPKGAVLSWREASELAAKFAEAIPERELSMAALQGYLMMYKIRPQEAVNEAQAWVEKELADIAARPSRGKRRQ